MNHGCRYNPIGLAPALDRALLQFVWSHFVDFGFFLKAHSFLHFILFLNGFPRADHALSLLAGSRGLATLVRDKSIAGWLRSDETLSISVDEELCQAVSCCDLTTSMN